MVDWLLQAENTQQGSNLALFLAIMAAFLHAIFGALQKGKFDPWLMRAAIDLSYGLMALPFALFVVPWPENYMWPLFFGAFIIVSMSPLLSIWKPSTGFPVSAIASTIFFVHLGSIPITITAATLGFLPVPIIVLK